MKFYIWIALVISNLILWITSITGNLPLIQNSGNFLLDPSFYSGFFLLLLVLAVPILFTD